MSGDGAAKTAGAGADLLLESILMGPVDAERPAPCRLVLSHRGGAPVSGFRLALSGPARIPTDPTITGGRLVHRLSNYAEIAPEPGLTLAAGESWTIEIAGMRLHHWTDGPAGAFLILADGSALPVETRPLRQEGNAAARRRGTMALAGDADATPLAIVPFPREVHFAGRRDVPQGFAVSGDDAVAATFAELTATLFPGEGLARDEEAGGLPVRLVRADGTAAGAYVLAWDAGGATIEAAGPAGLLYGLVTLAQMQRGARHRPDRYRFPASGRIADAPALGWRGCHLDVARRYYAAGELRRFLAILCWNKLNVFHWHLSDDEAWRVEIEAYPELTAVGAWRGHGLALPPLLGSGAARDGGVYSKASVRDLVGWAGRLGIDVVPEIDVPGHCYALLAALPQLRDPGEARAYYSIQHFPNNCLNPGVAAVMPALETILGELCELFPGRYFHAGADEVPEDAWSDSPAAAALAETLGVRGTAPLQAHFLKQVQAFLAGRGKVTGAWEEAAEGGGIPREQCYLVGWRSAEASRRLAGEGYDVVVAPGQAYYLDMANGEAFAEPGAHWAGWSSPEKTHAFDPAAGWSAGELAHLRGVQACIWSEPMRDPGAFDRLVFPRLSAIAETGWRGGEGRDWGRFAAAVELMPNQYGTLEGDHA